MPETPNGDPYGVNLRFAQMTLRSLGRALESSLLAPSMMRDGALRAELAGRVRDFHVAVDDLFAALEDAAFGDASSPMRPER